MLLNNLVNIIKLGDICDVCNAKLVLKLHPLQSNVYLGVGQTEKLPLHTHPRCKSLSLTRTHFKLLSPNRLVTNWFQISSVETATEDIKHE